MIIFGKSFFDRRKLKQEKQYTCYKCEPLYFGEPIINIIKYKHLGTTALCPRCDNNTIVPWDRKKHPWAHPHLKFILELDKKYNNCEYEYLYAMYGVGE